MPIKIQKGHCTNLLNQKKLSIDPSKLFLFTFRQLAFFYNLKEVASCRYTLLIVQPCLLAQKFTEGKFQVPKEKSATITYLQCLRKNEIKRDYLPIMKSFIASQKRQVSDHTFVCKMKIVDPCIPTYHAILEVQTEEAVYKCLPKRCSFLRMHFYYNSLQEFGKR